MYVLSHSIHSVVIILHDDFNKTFAGIECQANQASATSEGTFG